MKKKSKIKEENDEEEEDRSENFEYIKIRVFARL